MTFGQQMGRCDFSFCDFTFPGEDFGVRLVLLPGELLFNPRWIFCDGLRVLNRELDTQKLFITVVEEGKVEIVYICIVRRCLTGCPFFQNQAVEFRTKGYAV